MLRSDQEKSFAQNIFNILAKIINQKNSGLEPATKTPKMRKFDFWMFGYGNTEVAKALTVGQEKFNV